MKSILKYSILILIFAFSISCNKQHYTVYSIKETSKKIPTNGLFYYLPKTNLQLEVVVEKTDNIKGPYHAYAEKLLGFANIINENSSSYSIIKIKTHTQTEPNSEEIYYIALNGNQKKQLSIQLNEQGMLKSINIPEKESKTNITTNSKTNELELQAASSDFQMYLNYNILEKVDTIFETIFQDTIKVQKQILKKSYIEKSSEQKATEIADYIIKLKEYKMSLLTGYQEIAYDKATLNYMVQNIDDLINEHLALFTGKTITDVMTYKFDISPQQQSQSETVFAFAFSRKNGITKIPTQDKSNNYYVLFSTNHSTDSIKHFVQTIQEEQKTKPKGIYYNIPELTNIAIVNNKNEVIFETKQMIHQFGTVHYMPASKNTKILFNESNSSIQNIVIE